ncbi:MAG: DUF371 domain-containing protein [Candidatus Bathyarchaeia archaeon]
MKVFELITAYGHPQILATHPTTLEVTKEKHVTSRGNCIIATGASKAALDLSPAFKRLAAQQEAQIVMTLFVGNQTVRITGRGNQGLTFTHATDLVVRRSNYTCPRTLMVEADKAAADLPRSIVEKLRIPGALVLVRLMVETKT